LTWNNPKNEEYANINPQVVNPLSDALLKKLDVMQFQKPGRVNRKVVLEKYLSKSIKSMSMQ
jgi:hypothetical protein